MSAELVYKSPSTLHPYYNNPRKNDQAVLKVAESIQTYGFQAPILVDPDHTIIAGHTRYLAALKLDLDQVPVIVSGLSGDKARGYSLADNRTGEEADWNFELLANELDALDLEEMYTGFDEEEFDEILSMGFTEDDPAADEVPEVEDAVSETGDLWILGDHRVLCGDATKKEDVERLMDGNKADMVFTDPPYGMNLDTDWTSIKGSKRSKIDFTKMGGGNKYDKVIGDEKDFDPTFILEIFDYCKEIFLWGGDYYCRILPKGTWIVWDKRLNDSADKMIGSSFEILWSKVQHKKDIIRQKWAGIYGLSSQDTKSRLHPTQKPTEVNTWVIQKYSEKNDIIIDLFLGSGSTLIACEKTNRQCYGMEIDPHYVDVIVKRWEDYTGQTATTESGKTTQIHT